MDETASSITAALKSLFQNRKPINIQSDKGTEFVNNCTTVPETKGSAFSYHSQS
jgi:hypothetical protein